MNVLDMRRNLWSGLVAGLLAGIVGLAGCNNADPGAGSGSAANADKGSLPVASISAPAVDDDPEDPDEPDDSSDAKVELKEGTPEWLIREAVKLRVESPPTTDDVELLKKLRKDRNEKIIKLCQQVIAQVHKDAEKERLFASAVHNMLEARLQLALAGDRENIDALYDDAADLFKRDPKAAAAADAAHTLVNLAYSMAKGGTGSNPQWLGEFARQAIHFAGNFPDEERRSLPLLFTAARSCELAGMNKEAIDAYTLIQQQFPQNQYAARSAGILRRLKLPGNPPQLSGPTLDDDQVVLDDLLGNPVLVVFWSSAAKTFVDGLPKLMEVTRSYGKQGLKTIGVNVDPSPTGSQFVVEHRIPWPQIVFTEPEKQGWNNPIVNYYGILEVPALWLIDQNGNVVSTSVTLDSLERDLGKLMGTEPAKSAEEGAVKPASGTSDDRPKKKTKKTAPRDEE